MSSNREIVVIAHNIRSLHNVGSIFRTADGAGVSHLYLTGYTGTPPRSEIAKVALGSELVVPWSSVKNIATAIKQLKAKGYSVVALEQDPRAIDYKTAQLREYMSKGIETLFAQR